MLGIGVTNVNFAERDVQFQLLVTAMKNNRNEKI